MVLCISVGHLQSYMESNPAESMVMCISVGHVQSCMESNPAEV